MYNLKSHLLGVFELFLFMRCSLDRFSDDVKSFRQSFIIVGLNFSLIPIVIPYVYISNEEFQNLALEKITLLFFLKFLSVFILSLGFSYAICKFLKREEYFKRYISITNWSSLIAFISFLPIIYLMKIGIFTHTDLTPYLFLMSAYLYVLGWYITRHVLKIPWQLAIFIMVCFLAIEDFMFKIMLMYIEY